MKLTYILNFSRLHLLVLIQPYANALLGDLTGLLPHPKPINYQKVFCFQRNGG